MSLFFLLFFVCVFFYVIFFNLFLFFAKGSIVVVLLCGVVFVSLFVVVCFCFLFVLFCFLLLLALLQFMDFLSTYSTLYHEHTTHWTQILLLNLINQYVTLVDIVVVRVHHEKKRCKRMNLSGLTAPWQAYNVCTSPVSWSSCHLPTSMFSPCRHLTKTLCQQAHYPQTYDDLPTTTLNSSYVNGFPMSSHEIYNTLGRGDCHRWLG